MHIYMTPDQEIQPLLKTLSEAGQINPEVITSQQETHRNRKMVLSTELVAQRKWLTAWGKMGFGSHLGMMSLPFPKRARTAQEYDRKGERSKIRPTIAPACSQKTLSRW